MIRNALLMAIFVLTVSSFCAFAGEPEPIAGPVEQGPQKLPDRYRRTAPAGKRHIIASKIVQDGVKKRMLSVQVVDLSLILYQYDLQYYRPARLPEYVKRFACMLVESSPDSHGEGKLLALQYISIHELMFYSSAGDIISEPSLNSIYVTVSVQDTGFGRRTVQVFAVDEYKATNLPEFDPGLMGRWPAPTMSLIGTLVLYAGGRPMTLTGSYDNNRLLLHAVAGKMRTEEDKSILLALDLATLKWSRLHAQMKELDDQTRVRF